jgi:hypothetical protein
MTEPESSERKCAKCGAYEEAGAVHKGQCVNCGAWLPERKPATKVIVSSERKLAENPMCMCGHRLEEHLCSVDYCYCEGFNSGDSEAVTQRDSAIVQETLRAAAKRADEWANGDGLVGTVSEEILALATPAILERVAAHKTTADDEEQGGLDDCPLCAGGIRHKTCISSSEVMTCGHPIACWQKEGVQTDIDGTSYREAHCAWCAERERVLDATQELRDRCATLEAQVERVAERDRRVKP